MKNKKNIIIGSLIAIVLVMAVGYAAFATTLNIQGTSSINSSWQIEIVSVTPDKTATGTAPNYTGAGDITHSIGSDKLTANFSTALISPGDLVTYTIVVENKGSIDAKLSTLTKTNSNNEAITFEIQGITEGETLAAGASKTFTAKVGYSSSVTTQPTNTSSSFGITLDYVQDDGSGTTPSTSTTVYRYSTDSWINNTTDISSMTEGTDYVLSLRELNASNFYLKHTVVNNIVTESFVCFITDSEHCLKGGNASFYNANKTLLQNQESWFTARGGSCGEGSSFFHCHAARLDVDAASDGSVYANDNDGARCGVYSGGASDCDS